MALDQKDKELVAIGASIGALCRPCIEHHIPAGRDAGLTEPQLARAVQVAQATHRIAVDLLFRRSRELLRSGEDPAGMAVRGGAHVTAKRAGGPGRKHRGQLPPAP